jgi:hypothetical protein
MEPDALVKFLQYAARNTYNDCSYVLVSRSGFMNVVLRQSDNRRWRQMSRCMVQNVVFDGFSETFFFG